MRGIVCEGPALQPLGQPPDDIARGIEQVLAQLPPQSRAVAELRLRHQRSTPAIAAELHVTPATVERHIRRVTVALKAGLLQPHG